MNTVVQCRTDVRTLRLAKYWHRRIMRYYAKFMNRPLPWSTLCSVHSYTRKENHVLQTPSR